MKHLYSFVILFLWLTAPSGAATLDIEPLITSGCAPMRYLFYNHSLGIDSIAINASEILAPYSVKYYHDSIELFVPQVYDPAYNHFYVKFYGFDNAKNLVDSTQKIALSIYYPYGPPLISSKNITTGESLEIIYIDPPDVRIPNIPPFNKADLGDGTFFYSSEYNLWRYHYCSPGTYKIHTTWNSGCNGSADFTVKVEGSKLKPHLEFPGTACVNTLVKFTLNFTHDMEPDSITFDYGEGETRSNTHIFSSAGDYKIVAYYRFVFTEFKFVDTIHIVQTGSCPRLNLVLADTAGCEPARYVFYNHSTNIDNIVADTSNLYKFKIKYYSDSIELFLSEVWNYGVDHFKIRFFGFKDGSLVDSTSFFNLTLYQNYGMSSISDTILYPGEPFSIHFPGSPEFRGGAPFNKAVLGDGTTFFDTQWGLSEYYYSTPGKYRIYTTWNSGCPNEKNFDVQVSGKPIEANFEFPRKACLNKPVTFTLNFINQYEGADSITFNFGSGETRNNTHIFTSPGLYPVKAYYRYLFSEYKFEDTISIIDTSVCPVVDIRARNMVGCAPLRCVFDNFSVGVDSIAVDDHLIYMDYTIEYYQDSIVMVFPAAYVIDLGTFSVGFKGYDADGNLIGTSPYFAGIIHWNFGPATIDKDTVCNGEILNIEFPVFNPSFQDTPYNHADLGDGTTFDGPWSDLAYYYSSPGIYHITTLWHPVCPPNETDFTVRVNNCTTLPSHFSFIDSVCSGTSVKFTLNFNNGQGPDSIRFNYGAGITSSDTHIFSSPGNFLVRAYYYYRDYLVLTFSDTIHILSCPCFAELHINKKTLCPGISTNFCAKAEEIDSVLWNFGDGTTSNQTCVEKSYSIPGIYYVRLTVYSPCGTGVYSDSVTILGATKKDSLFEIVPDHAISMTPIHFNALGNFKNVEWDITKASVNVDTSNHTPDINDLLKIIRIDTNKWVYTYMHHFTKSIYNCGIYLVTFKHNTCGIAQSEFRVLDIDPKDPDRVLILKGAENYYVGKPVELSATGASVYLWSFGDNSTELTLDPVASIVSHVYYTPGVKTISLSTVDDCLNLNYATEKVNIIDNPYTHLKQSEDLKDVIEIYPNPVKTELLLKVSESFGLNYTVTVYNSLGEVIVFRSFKNASSEGYTINFQNIPSGTYFIKFENGNKRQLKTFVKE